MTNRTAQNSTDAAYGDAERAFHEGRLSEAEQTLLDSLDRSPRAAQSVYLLGLVKLGQHDFAAAKAAIDRAFAIKSWVREYPSIGPSLEDALLAARKADPDWIWPAYDRERRACFTPGVTLENLCRLGVLPIGTRFVQIGANDGVSGDPIRSYVIEGKWTGLLVEPLPAVFEQLKHNYDGVDGLMFANAAVTPDEGPVRLHVEREGKSTLASLVPDRNALSKTRAEIEVVEVPGRQLMPLLRDHGLDELDLLQIDTEGFDYQVLRQVDFDAVRPRVINMEFYCLPLEERLQTFDLLREHDYVYRFDHRDLLAVTQDLAEQTFGAVRRY